MKISLQPTGRYIYYSSLCTSNMFIKFLSPIAILRTCDFFVTSTIICYYLPRYLKPFTCSKAFPLTCSLIVLSSSDVFTLIVFVLLYIHAQFQIFTMAFHLVYPVGFPNYQQPVLCHMCHVQSLHTPRGLAVHLIHEI